MAASAAAGACPPGVASVTVTTEGVALDGATKLGAADLRADGGVECDATSVLATCSDAPRGGEPIRHLIAVGCGGSDVQWPDAARPLH